VEKNLLPYNSLVDLLSSEQREQGLIRVSRICLLVFIAVFLLSACGGGGQSVSPTAPVTLVPPATPTFVPTLAPRPTPTLRPSSIGTVRLWLSWDAQEMRGLKDVIEAFLEKNPGIELSVAYFPPDELLDAVKMASVRRDTPSVFFAPASWGPELWQSGLLLDLTSRVNAELEEAILPLAWTQVSHRGAVLGLPLEMQGIALYRNRSLVSEPAGTMEEWIESSQEIKDGEVVGSALDFGFFYAASHISACGGSIFAEGGDLAIDSPAGICWLDMLATLRQAGRITFNTLDDQALFEAGQSAWLIDDSLNSEHLGSAIGPGNLAIDPWPVYQGTGQRMAGYTWTENAYFIRGTAPLDLEASWLFIQFLLSPEIQLMLSEPENARHLPTLAGLELRDVHQAQLFAALSAGVSLPLRMDLELYQEPLENAVRSVAVQGASPQLAIEVALAKIELASPGPDEDE
jgi:ABC-type glycerol-3-phosphate transport system substrate-binding protein